MYLLTKFIKTTTILTFMMSCSDFSEDKGSSNTSTKITRIWSTASSNFSVTDIDHTYSLALDDSSCKNTTKIFKKKAAEKLYFSYLNAAKWLDKKNNPVYSERWYSEPVPVSAEIDSSKAPEYSDTNNQVEGVEEADILKTDGHYIFLASEGAMLNIMTKDHKIIKTFKLNKSLQGTAKLVLGKNKTIFAVLGDGRITKVYKINYQNESKISSTLLSKFKGNRRTIRKLGDTLYLVFSEYFDEGFDSSPYIYSDLNERNISTYFKNGLERLEKMKLAEILGASDELVNRLCSKMYIPTHDVATNNISYSNYTSSRFGLTKVISIDLVNKSMSESGLAEIAEHVYMNKSSLYISSGGYGDLTRLHKFSVDGEISYKGSTGIEGRILNQFSMDEHKGVLRVAVTKRHWDRDNSLNQVITLNETEGKKLKIIGETQDLAKGERIYSVRFHGEKGYVVTFREIDPLFTLDLKDPERPEVLGELKIPGFSTYMHMIGSEKILAIGDSGSGRVKLSLFDVSDMAAPSELDNLILTDSYYSEAQYNHLAFNYFAPLKKLALPVPVGSGKNEIKVFDINDTISEAGSFSFSKCRHRQHQSRSLFIGDRIYGVSSKELMSAQVGDIENSEATRLNIGKCDYEVVPYWY